MTTYIVKIKSSNTVFDARDSSSVLESAFEQGIQLKYACNAGSCGACKIKLIEGKVEMDHCGGISREDIANNYVLACCTIPMSNLILNYE
jgi:carbapenem biosynthesis protein CpmE